VTIAADGEVMVSGSAMLGYLGKRRDEADLQIATGDLGRIDEEGYLHITGRKKNVQITAFGRNFSRVGGSPGPALPGHRPHRHLR
jgi:long-subunit acyl-CoA synthetase (AMP-forming)